VNIAVWHNLPSGGGKRALYHHVKGLLGRGHTVECWCPSTAERTYLPLSDLTPEHTIPLRRPNPTHGSAWRLATYHLDALRLRRQSRKAARQFAREIAGRFDVVFANSCHFYAAPSVAPYVETPCVAYLQEPFRPLYEASPAIPWVWVGNVSKGGGNWLGRTARSLATAAKLPVLQLRAREEWRNAHAADRILVNSRYSRESVLRTYGLDARVCYLGVDTHVFRPLPRERERFVVGLGAMRAEKRVSLAIQALSCLATPRPPLVWIANTVHPEYHDEMRRLARDAGVDLQLHTRISDEQIVDFLNRAEVMLYTSRLEPFGLAVLEAGACGAAVVAVAEGGVRETIVDGVNGLLVEAEPDPIARAVGTLLSDPALARELGQNAMAHVRENWSVEKSVERIERHLFEAVAAGKQ
jgi:glycosyltransferase involved in cell wall biosynthesis